MALICTMQRELFFSCYDFFTYTIYNESLIYVRFLFFFGKYFAQEQLLFYKSFDTFDFCYLTAQLNFIKHELIIIKYAYLSFKNSGSTTQRLFLFLSKFQCS